MTRMRLWNANIHYHRLLVSSIPEGAAHVLDVGCGDGVLSADLVQAGVLHVVALDVDAGVLSRARARHVGLPIEWIHGDVFDSGLANHRFDAVVSVATLHHLDATAGLIRFAQLVRPGGVVGVVGLATDNWWEWPFTAVGQCARIAASVTRGYWEHSAPMAWPPPVTYREMRQIARQILPGVQYRRHLYGRYSLIWTRPTHR